MAHSPLEEYKGIIGLIRFFVDTYRWGVVDRLALAMGAESIEAALYDMLRLVESLYGRRNRVRIKADKKVYDTTCCEYGEDLGYGIHGVIEKVYEGNEELKGKKIYCVPCPPRPDELEIKKFLEDIKEDPSIARKIALLSFGRREHKEEGGVK